MCNAHKLHSVARALCAVVRAAGLSHMHARNCAYWTLCRCALVATPSSQPASIVTQKAQVATPNSQPCRDREKHIAIRFFSHHVAFLSRHQKPGCNSPTTIFVAIEKFLSRQTSVSSTELPLSRPRNSGHDPKPAQFP